jgi:hypothetical protein
MLALPRTTTQLGQFVSIDSIVSVATGDGAFSSTASFTVDPLRLTSAYPHYAKYLQKYVGPVIAQATIADSSGTPWMLASYDKGRLVVRWRSIDGRLVPLSGSTRALPARLRLTMDASSRFGMMTVGVKHLVMELRLATTTRERSFTLTARQSPDWQLPLAAERLLRTPLERPFMGAGASFTLGVRDTAGRSFLFSRSHLAVEESAILRLLSHLSRGAVTDFDSPVASEEEAFWSGVCNALRADLRGG